MQHASALNCSRVGRWVTMGRNCPRKEGQFTVVFSFWFVQDSVVYRWDINHSMMNLIDNLEPCVWYLLCAGLESEPQPCLPSSSRQLLFGHSISLSSEFVCGATKLQINIQAGVLLVYGMLGTWQIPIWLDVSRQETQFALLSLLMY